MQIKRMQQHTCKVQDKLAPSLNTRSADKDAKEEQKKRRNEPVCGVRTYLFGKPSKSHTYVK
jgi:hypothetical protein